MKILEKILDWLYPKHIKCIFCGNELNEFAENDTCEDCFEILPYVKNPCPRCGGETSEDNSGVCFDCKRNNYEFNKAVCAFKYAGSVVKVVRNFKYHGYKFLFEPMGNYMCEALARAEFKFDYVSCVPIHKTRLKQRKYNQAELLAKYVAQTFNVPYVDFVEKCKDTGSQTALSFKERQENIKDSFTVKREVRQLIKSKAILIVDDVFTTGATTNEISKLLKSAGASETNVLTFAHTEAQKDI